MSTPLKNAKNKPIRIIDEKSLFPQLKLFNSCINLSQLISDYFLNKSSLTNLTNNQMKPITDFKEKLNINIEIIYKEILNDKIFMNDLNILYNSINSIINHLEEYYKKFIDDQKIKILFDLNEQLNDYLNNIPKEKDKKLNYFISPSSKVSDNHIIEQINKFISLNEKDEQESKETIIIHKENNFDNLSEIGIKESDKDSIFEDEKEIIKHLFKDKKPNEKIFKNEDEFELNEDLSFLNQKYKRNKDVVNLDD